MTMSNAGQDELTEYLINHAYRLMLAAKTTDEQRHWCERMAHYIGQRSQAKVAEMEALMGLA